MDTTSRIELSQVPQVTYEDSNGNHVLDDDDKVTVNGTPTNASTFAMISDAHRNLVIDKAERKGIDATRFAEKHPLTGKK